MAKKLDTGIPDPRLAAIGAALDEATGAAVAIVGDEVAHTALTLLKGLGGQTQTEPFARETDFMKQLQAGNIAGAATILANQAEGAITGATTMAVERAESLTGQARQMASDVTTGGPLTITEVDLPAADHEVLTDEEEIEETISPEAAAVLTSTDTAMTPGIGVRPDEAMKPVPDSKPAQVAGADALPDSDAGGLARGDIDPAAAGVNDIFPPGV